MSKHDHHHCQHTLAYCSHCDTAYCTRCDAEWKPPCRLSHYPTYIITPIYKPWVPTSPWQPTWIYGARNTAEPLPTDKTISVMGQAAQSSAMALKAPDDEPVSVCTHGR